jgi:hypothetical protein
MNHRLLLALLLLLALSLVRECFLGLAHAQGIAQMPQTPKSIEQERKTIAAQHLDSVVVWEYAVNNNKPNKRGRVQSVIQYDINGNIIKASQFLDRQTETDTEYRYDAAMRLVEERPIVRRGALGGAPAYYWHYRYDAQQRMAEAHYLTPTGEIAQKKIFQYLTNALPTDNNTLREMLNALPSEIIFYRNPSTIGYRDVYSFREPSAFLVQKIRYRADSTVEQREEYRYDTKGQIIERLLYAGISVAKPSGELVSRTVYSYDVQGNLLEETNIHENTTALSKQKHRYDQTGLRVETQYFWSAKPPLRLTSVRKYLYSRCTQQ